jgi:hypothetical protein
MKKNPCVEIELAGDPSQFVVGHDSLHSVAFTIGGGETKLCLRLFLAMLLDVEHMHAHGMTKPGEKFKRAARL